MSDNTNSINIDDQTNTQFSKVQIDNISSNIYVASSIERKKSLMMYYLFGIIMSLDKKDLSGFESFHIKQATGWWLIAIVWILLSIILSFISYGAWIGIPIWLILMIFFGFYNFQAINGQYKLPEKAKGNLFYGLGSRLMLIFEV